MKTKHYLLCLLLFAVQLNYGQYAKYKHDLLAKNQRSKPIKQNEQVLKIKNNLKTQVQKETSLRRNEDPEIFPSHGYVVYYDGLEAEYGWNFFYIRDDQNRIKSATYYDTIEKENYYKIDVNYNKNGLITSLTIFDFWGPITIPEYKDSFEYHDVYTDYITASYTYEFEGKWELYEGYRKKITVDGNNNITEIISESYNDYWDQNQTWTIDNTTNIFYINNRIAFIIDSLYSWDDDMSYEEKYTFLYNQNEISGFIIQNKYNNDILWQNKLKVEDLDYNNYKFDYVKPFILKSFENPYIESVYDIFRYNENDEHILFPAYIDVKSYKEYTWFNDEWIYTSKTEISDNNNEFEYVFSNWNNSSLTYELSKRLLVTKSVNSTQTIWQTYEDNEWVNKEKFILYSLLNFNKAYFLNLDDDENPYAYYIWEQNNWKLNDEWKIEIVTDPQTGKYLYVNKSYFYWGLNESRLYNKIIYTQWGPFAGDNTSVKLIEKNPFASIYPNPCNNQLYIQLPENNNPIEIVISDINGKKVYQTQNDNSLLSIDFSELKQGVYFIKIRNGQLSEIHKIVKY
jgi:hypothetical protein